MVDQIFFFFWKFMTIPDSLLIDVRKHGKCDTSTYCSDRVSSALAVSYGAPPCTIQHKRKNYKATQWLIHHLWISTVVVVDLCSWVPGSAICPAPITTSIIHHITIDVFLWHLPTMYISWSRLYNSILQLGTATWFTTPCNSNSEKHKASGALRHGTSTLVLSACIS